MKMYELERENNKLKRMIGSKSSTKPFRKTLQAERHNLKEGEGDDDIRKSGKKHKNQKVMESKSPNALKP